MAIEAQKHGKVDIKRPFTRPALLDSPTPLQYPVQDCLRKQIFDLNSAQSPSNSNFSTFVYHQIIFPMLMENIRQVSCVKILNLMVLCK